MMAVLSESLLYCTQGPLRMQALSAWLCFVQLLAKHAPHVLERIAAQAAVVLLPVLEPGDTQVKGFYLILCRVERCTSNCCVRLAGILVFCLTAGA
jgi:hypothetical protein